MFVPLVSSWNLQQIQNFGEPFFLVIHEGETLADIKMRIKKKLQVADEEFAKVFPLLSSPIAQMSSILSEFALVRSVLLTRHWVLNAISIFLTAFCYISIWPVEVCFPFIGASWVSSGHWYCIQSVSGALIFRNPSSINNLNQYLTVSLFYLNLCLCGLFIVSCDREEMFMEPGSSILVWSIPTMLLKDHTLLTRLVTNMTTAYFVYMNNVLWLCSACYHCTRITSFTWGWNLVCLLHLKFHGFWFQSRHTFEKPVKIYN